MKSLLDILLMPQPKFTEQVQQNGQLQQIKN